MVRQDTKHTADHTMEQAPEVKGRISVIMGIYNCEATLPQAIESLLQQQYTNWELIMCDDGSHDGTRKVAEAYRDKYPDRIKVLMNEVNCGVNITLNKCLQASTGEFIARQDGDDESLPERFAVQVKYLYEHPDCDFVGTGMTVSNGSQIVGERLPSRQVPRSHLEILQKNRFFHATVLFRRTAMMAVGGYTEHRNLLRVEDYDLWAKLYAHGFRGENIMRSYYLVLEDSSTYSRRKFKYRLNRAYAVLRARKMLKLPWYYSVYALRGIMIGLLPGPLYRFLHERRLRKVQQGNHA